MDSLSQSLSFAVGALAAWRLGEGPFVRPPRPEYCWPDADKTVHRAVTRVVSPADIDYLRTEPDGARDLVRHLRADRKAFLKAYLREMRASFSESSTTVRQFAADSDAPDLALTALRQTVRFYAFWFLLRASLTCNLAGPVWRLTERMLGWGRAEGSRGASDEAQAARP